MNTRHVNFATFQCGEGEAAAHQARHQVVLVVSSEVLCGEKHRRVASSHNDLSPHGLPILEQADFNAIAAGIGADDQTVRGDAQTGEFAETVERPHQESLANPSYVSPKLIVASRKRTDKFAFNDFAAALDAEQVFNSAAQSPRELKRN